ncbi:unnamed protein product [Prunus brigantina]
MVAGSRRTEPTKIARNPGHFSTFPVTGMADGVGNWLGRVGEAEPVTLVPVPWPVVAGTGGSVSRSGEGDARRGRHRRERERERERERLRAFSVFNQKSPFAKITIMPLNFIRS